ncbi:MAG TPA: GNAT family N-acetyltransferase [Bradyrhizobium sp.]|nr:GNAT family N-acetyltransferase [Bradyrhizobium sp.]
MVSVTICSPSLAVGEHWQNLVSRARPNVFMDPAALTAASVTNFAEIRVLLAWDEGHEPRKLVGLWALRIRKIAPFWPATLEALPYNYAFLSTPVIDGHFIERVIPAFLDAIAETPDMPRVINLPSFNADAPACDVLARALAARAGARLIVAEHQRPFASREFGVKRSGSTRKKLRQDWKRLSAAGTADVGNDRSPAAVRAAFETFLALEAGSWKGARKTALLCDTRDAAFVRRLIGELADRGNASVALLRVDGRPIAAQVLMYCGSTAYTWKTAFDAEYAKYSPGALLVDQVTEQLFSSPGVDAIDSCAVEESFMGQIWAGRRKMADILVDVGPGRSPAFAMEAGRHFTYRRLRELRRRVRNASWTAPRKRPVAVAN